MRDASFTLNTATAEGPFSKAYDAGCALWRAHWRIFDRAGAEVGIANTRAGARRAVRALYGAPEHG